MSTNSENEPQILRRDISQIGAAASKYLKEDQSSDNLMKRACLVWKELANEPDIVLKMMKSEFLRHALMTIHTQFGHYSDGRNVAVHSDAIKAHTYTTSLFYVSFKGESPECVTTYILNFIEDAKQGGATETLKLNAAVIPLSVAQAMAEVNFSKSFEGMVHNEGAKGEFQAILEFLNNHPKDVESIKAQIGTLKEELKRSEDFARQIKSDFNFAGLSNGLEAISKRLKDELRLNIAGLVILIALLMIAPIVAVKIHMGMSGEILSHMYVTIPFIAIEVVLIFVLRMMYFEYRQRSSEMTQIEYRHMLCSFVMNYAEFKKGHKELDLEAFERLVFKNLPINHNHPESPLEGVRELLEAAKSAKPKADGE